VLGTIGWSAIRVFSAAVIFTPSQLSAVRSRHPWRCWRRSPRCSAGSRSTRRSPRFSASLEGGDDGWFPALNRFVLIPMFLFAGTFFPVSQLPDWLEPVAWATPLWHGVELCRMLTTGNVDALLALVHVGYLSLFVVVGAVVAIKRHQRALLK
jgi:lipooligosaccharide transport system permease protein